MTETLSAAQARRIALAAQGFGAAPGARNAAAFRRTARRLGVIQIDSVNVVTRTHYLPAFSRLGPYPRDILESEAWGRKRSLFEYWGHEASLLPVETQPLFRWRMAAAEAGEGIWGSIARFGHEKSDYVDGILTEIGRRRGVTGGDFAEGPRGAPGWWEWSDGKRALEWLFWTGRITTLTRRGFERVYDLPERALPRAVVEAPTRAGKTRNANWCAFPPGPWGSPPPPTCATISACRWPTAGRGSRSWSRPASSSRS